LRAFFRAKRFGVRRVLAPLSTRIARSVALSLLESRERKRHEDAPHSKALARKMIEARFFGRSSARPIVGKS
jgi:hypothetical protein